MAKFCFKCGAALPDGTKFCPECGTQIQQAAPQPQQQPQPQQPQQPQPQIQRTTQTPVQPVKKKGKGGLIAAVAVVLAAAIIVTGFWWPGFFKMIFGGKSEKFIVTHDSPKATGELGVSVEFPQYLIGENEEIEIKVKEAGSEQAKNGDYRITAYDISAGDMHELDTYIQIRIPYDGSFCSAGSDPSKCVCAKYKNEQTGEWENVIYTVDAENKELVIDTDHFSIYGAFEVADEGLRNAYITNVNDYNYYIPEALSVNAVREWLSSGEEGDACFKVADIYVQDMIKDVILNSAGNTGDIMGNLYTVTQMGDFKFDSKTLATGNEKLGKAIGRFGKIAAAANIAYTVMKPEKTSEEIISLYKDCFNFALSFSEDTALGISMVGVWVIDKSLNAFGEQVQSMRISTVAPVYRYFNDSFDGNSDNYKGENKARTSLEWLAYLKKLAKATKGDQETFKKMLEDEVDSYARRWWNLPLAKQEDYARYIQTEIKTGGTAGSYWYSALSATEKENMITTYKGELYDRLIPLMNKLSVDSINDLKKQTLNALKEIGNLLSAKIPVHIHEEVPDGEKALYGKHAVCFSELSEGAVKKDWTGKLSSKGTIDTTITQIGYLIAGSPKKLDIYEPKAEVGKDKPLLSVPVIFNSKEIDIAIAHEDSVTLDDIIGEWNVRATFSDMESPIVGWLRSFFDSIFGEGSGEDIVESGIDEDTTVDQVLKIEKDGSSIIATLYSDDDVSVYDGTFKNGKLKLKFRKTSTEEGTIELTLNELEYEFSKSDGKVVMEGSYDIKSALFKAKYKYKGTKK